LITTTKEELALKELFSNRRLTLETLLEIENKERQLVKFNLNPIQADMLSTFTGRDIYVKPAQIGATSLWVGDFLIDNITINGTVSVIISYDEFSAQRLLLKAKKYHQCLQRRIPTIARLDHKSATELSFEDKRTGFYSTFYIFSARSYVLGRGETLHNLLLDEFAFYPEGTHEEIFSSAVKRVPLVKGTKIVVQSTPNGEDNAFCAMYRDAKARKAIHKHIFFPHFYEWYLHPEYSMLMDSDFVMSGDDTFPLQNLQPDEEVLLKRFAQLGISEFESHNKLRWRRYAREEMKSLRRSGDTVKLFEQENPEDDTTCFISFGNPAYDRDIVTEKLYSCYEAPIHKNFVNSKGISADCDIWEYPKEGVGYVIGGDPGKAKTSESVAMVFTFEDGYTDKDNKEHSPRLIHVATLSGWYDEAEFGEYMKLLGHFYNEAVLAPEDNLDLVAHVKDYPQLYYREDVRNGKGLRSIGWQTNVSTKPYMISEVNRNLEYIECYDKCFWEQLNNVQRDPTSKSGISVKGPEDYHMAGGIAIVCRGSRPVHIGYVGSSGDSGGWGTNW
jgi:hypothetical protein